MIKINLLGKIEEPKKPPKVKRERKSIFTARTIIYSFVLLIAVGVLIYTYFPEILGISEPVAYVPPPIQAPVVTKQAEDTTKQVVKKEEPKPEPPPEPQKPEIVEDYLINAYFTNQMELNGFSALRDAVSEGTEYTLITVDEKHFIAEFAAESKYNIAQYNINLKKRIPEGGIKIIDVHETAKENKLIAQIWGYLYENNGLKKEYEVSFKEFYKPSEIISKIRKIALESGFVLKSVKTLVSFEKDNYQKSPVLLKFQGIDNNSVRFIENLKKENLNYAIQKISGVPEINKERVSIAISLEVFIPSS
ncbi:hypothetical protein ACFL4Z_00315 [candidate division KSB1 bacterium]